MVVKARGIHSMLAIRFLSFQDSKGCANTERKILTQVTR